MRRAIIALILLAALPCAAQTTQIRGMHLNQDFLMLDYQREALSGAWTCVAGVSACTGAGGDAATELDDGDIILLSDGANWQAYEVDGEPSGADALSRKTTLPSGAAQTLEAIAGSAIYLVNTGLDDSLDVVMTGSAGTSPLSLSDSTSTASSGTRVFAKIAPTVNQSGTAGFTLLEIDFTNTSLGSGPALLQDWAVGGSTKAKIDRFGTLSAAQITGINGDFNFVATAFSLANDMTVLWSSTAAHGGAKDLSYTRYHDGSNAWLSIEDGGGDNAHDGRLWASIIKTATLQFDGHNHDITVPAGFAITGPTAPDFDTHGTFSTLGFDADAESAGFEFEVRGDWDTTSDMYLRVYWFGDSGDAVADTETVKWDAEYRCVATGEAYDNGSSVTATATYTQSGAGTDKETFVTSITLDYDHADQPMADDDVCGFNFTRDVSGDSYSGEAHVIQWEIRYTSISMSKHS